MKTLILTEKPSVAMDFARGLGISGRKDGYLENSDYVITWAIGHLVELLEPQDYKPRWRQWRFENLPIIPENYQYKPIKKTAKQLKIVQRLLARRDIAKIVVATDAGREGEVIARTVLQSTDAGQRCDVLRFWTSQALTPQVIQAGMNALAPGADYDRLWHAGRARQIADWLVGMNGSRAATIRMKDLFSVGRVQTAVLALLVARRQTREHFKPEPYWLVRATFKGQKGIWIGLWINKGQSRIDRREAALRIVDSIRDRTGTVTSAKKMRKRQPPPLLYSLTDLQQDANVRFGLTAKHTLEIAQGLYEQKKCISYPRTDAKVLGSKNEAMVQDLVKKLGGAYPDVFDGIDPKLTAKSNKRVYNDAKLTDHHALIPLRSLPPNSSEAEHKIYTLILHRFAAAFYPDCVFDTREILTQVDDTHIFRTRGKVIVEPGWQAVLKPVAGKKSKTADEPDQQDLPPLEAGDSGQVADTEIQDKQTTPPPEYTDALLLKDMTQPGRYVSQAELKKIYRGDVGLGTQATRAQIIETLLTRGYLRRAKKMLVATDKGVFLIDNLKKMPIAGTLASPENTAKWEMALEAIAEGNGSAERFLTEIENFVRQTVSEFQENPIQAAPRPAVGRCPACGGQIVDAVRTYACTGQDASGKACELVIWKQIAGKKISSQMAAMLLNGKSIGPYQDWVSKKKTKFTAAARLIQHNGNWSVRFVFGSVDNRPVVAAPPAPDDRPALAMPDMGCCPQCGGPMIKGRKDYGCSHWRASDGGCRFVICATYKDKKLTGANIKTLCSGKTTAAYVFKDESGQKYRAKLQLAKDAAGRWQVNQVEKSVY